MTALFIRLADFFRSHRWACWLSMAALFAFFGYYAMQIHLEEDINKLMPSSKNEDGTTKLAFADLKIKDKTFLLFERISGNTQESGNADLSGLIAVCDAFIDSLQQDTALIEDVFYRLAEGLLGQVL